MSKARSTTQILLLLLLLGVNVQAQTADPQARDAEWKNLKLPAAEFKRYVDPAKILLLRVPASWERTGLMKFKGPDDSELQVVIEQVPDGISLKSYTNAVLQGLGNLPGGADALTVRRTNISAIEAREFFFTIPDLLGRPSRRLLWCTVSGPHAVSFVFAVPEDKAPELEPYFKAVVESAVIFESDAHFTLFDNLRSKAIKEDKPARVDEVRSLAAVIDGFDASARAKAVASLAALMNSAPDSAIDLLVDRRSLVRAGAVEALGLSSNHALDGFLLQALADPSAFVAARAARALAKREDAVKLLRDDSAGWDGLQIERVMRAAALLNDRARSQIAAELTKDEPARRVRRKVPPPPPPTRTPSQQPKPKVSVQPPAITGDVAVTPGFIPVAGYNDEAAVLTMLPYVESMESVLTPARLSEEADNVGLYWVLTVALEARTKLPADSLIKLLSSGNGIIARLAAFNLAVSGATSDIPRLESFGRNVVTVTGSKQGDSGHQRTLTEELLVTAKKIRWRERFSAASSQAARDESIKQAMADVDLAGFAWPYVRDVVEGSGPREPKPMRGAGPVRSTDSQKSPPPVSRLAENLFPSRVALYTAIPDAQGMIDKFADSFSHIQLESARNQANLLLMIKAIESKLAGDLEARDGAGILESGGIKPHSPLVLARWTADAAPRGLKAAQRKAVVVRVSDRDRFENFLTTFHRKIGRFEMLPEYVAGGARFLSLLPAFVPLVAAAMTGEQSPVPRTYTKKYSLIGEDNCSGYPVTVIELREVGSMYKLSRDTIYLTYVGDAAILATDWFSLRDCLMRLEGKGEQLAANSEFARASAAGGDVIYLSDPLALFASAVKNDSLPLLTESGALRISRSAWESSVGIALNNIDFQKPMPFSARQLKAPAELLPKSSLAYLFANFDMTAAWRGFSSELFGAEKANQIKSIWAVDFERDVLPELGREVGVALVGLPEFNRSSFEAPWVMFFETRSDKLATLFADGRLLKDSAKGAKSARVKVGSSDYWIAVRGRFLVVAGNEATFEKLDSSDHLNAAKDFQVSANAAPQSVIIFGGCNIEAAADSLKVDKNDPLMQQAVSALASLTRAFHSLNVYATLNDKSLDARMSVSIGREGRYSVTDLASLSKEFQIAVAEIEARGIPISDQQHLDSLSLRITSKAPGAIDRIKEDVATPSQVVEKRSDSELVVTVSARRPALERKVELPVTAAEFSPFLKSSLRVNSGAQSIITRAREIAGDDHDAWSVARKLADWTFKNLKWKRVDDADAARTLATLEADCLEFSELFVAMARALGLPARIVLGLAHGGSSFGGHAWVEVWVGEWVELDPTWGTNYVDATHIRSSAFELDSYAALNVIGIEVVGAKRRVADFQKAPGALAEALCEDLSGDGNEALSVAIEPAVLIDSLMGAGSWAGMSASERDPVYSSHRRLIAELHRDLRTDYGSGARLLKVDARETNADVLMISGDEELLAVRMLLKDGTWFVTEINYGELGFGLIGEAIRPVLLAMEAKRKGTKPPALLDSVEKRILIAQRKDAKLALQIAEQALKENPNNAKLRYLKATSLLRIAGKGGKAESDQALAVFSSLASEQPAFPPAVKALGDHFAADRRDPEKKDSQVKAIEYLERYANLAPADPRPHQSLARLYEDREDNVRAETEYKKVVELDPMDRTSYSSFASFLLSKSRFKDALAVIDQSKGRGESKDALFATLFLDCFLPEKAALAEGLAAAAGPERFVKNFDANLNYAWVLTQNDKPAAALPLLKHAVELNPKSATPHESMAEAYRKLRNWTVALKEAEQAIKLDENAAAAYFHRACALAQLRRPAEALAALRKAVEIDEDLEFSEDLETEPDLKPLAKMPGFRKLIEEIKAGGGIPAEPPKKNNEK